MGGFDSGEVMNNTVVYIGTPVYVTCAFSHPSSYLKIELLGHSFPPVPAVEESPGCFLVVTPFHVPHTPEDVHFSAYTWYHSCFL